MRILALDIGGTSIKTGVINENGDILESEEYDTEAYKGGNVLIKKIINIIETYNNIDRIGISSAGQIDPILGKVIYATDNIPGWTGMEIKNIIEEAFSIPTAVENDVNAAAIGEGVYGAGRGTDSFLCLTYGTGIGGAIVEKGEIYRGMAFSAGEFGHIITHGDGLTCTCGNKGCYERYASTSALIRSAKAKFKLEETSGKEIFDKIFTGNEEYKLLVNLWLKEVMLGLTSLTHIFNPSLIILGGGIMTQPYVIEYLNSNIYDIIMPNYRQVRFKAALLGNNAGILGASILAKRLE